jgi:hypothetical protein
MSVHFRVAVVFGLALIAMPASADEEITQLLVTIGGVTKEGKGNDNAGPAWKSLVSKGAPALIPTLTAMDDMNPTAANWLRTAVDAIVEGEKSAGRKLPAHKLEAFATSPMYSAAGRRLAYELLVSQDPEAKARLLPGFLNDKSAELRRDAIASQLEILEKAARPSLKADLEKLFAATRDEDQVELLAKKIAENGGKVSVTEHFGFVTFAALVGPFDAPESKGYSLKYPADTAKDMSGKFKGKENAELKWGASSTNDKLGTFDLNKLIGKHKNAVVHALAVIVSEREMPCEIRVTCPTSTKIFLNQKELFGHDEYHHGAPFDGIIGRGTLKKGENTIVLKVCQNNETDPRLQEWEFQMRVCDDTGGPLPGLTQSPLNGGKPLPLGSIDQSSEIKEDKK